MLVAFAKEHGKPTATVHGGAAAWVVAGGASPAMVGREEVLGRLNGAVRCSCARKKGGKGSGAGESMGAELTGELGRAPASDSHGRDTYHSEVTRARGARGGGGAAGEMESSTAS